MRLFIVNGPFGVGKSTVAKLLHEQFPMALMIAVDELRRLYNRYKEFRRDSILETEDLSYAMARVALGKGRVAIVEGVKAQESQMDPWVRLAREFSVPLHEVVLWCSKSTLLQRAQARGIAPGSSLSLDLVSWAWDTMDPWRAQRPGLIECNTEENTPEEIVSAIFQRAGLESPFLAGPAGHTPRSAAPTG